MSAPYTHSPSFGVFLSDWEEFVDLRTGWSDTRHLVGMMGGYEIAKGLIEKVKINSK